jgi:hypothetical protein
VISYCIACYRPVYARLLIDELIEKTSVPYEILLWLNVADADFQRFLAGKAAAGVPLRVVGETPHNIGMAAYPHLFVASRFGMVTQIDDDVVCISPGIAQSAQAVFDRFPAVSMLAADVWQDDYTTGARPPLDIYRVFDRDYGLYDGPIDGWFAVYRQESLKVCRIAPTRYFFLGAAIKSRLDAIGQHGLLCTGMKVFHVIGPQYAHHFGMLDAEIEKYRAVGRKDIVDWYCSERPNLPPASELAERVGRIRESFLHPPRTAGAIIGAG